MNPHNLKPGTKLYWVQKDSRYRRPTFVTVGKIGRKWAELKGNWGRVDMETLIVDGGEYASPARCYLSKEACEAEVEKEKVWSRLRQEIWSGPPPKCSVEEIRRAAGILGVELKARQS